MLLNVLRAHLGHKDADSGARGCLELAQNINLRQLLPMADAQLTEAESELIGSSAAVLGGQLGFDTALSRIQQALSVSKPDQPDAHLEAEAASASDCRTPG